MLIRIAQVSDYHELMHLYNLFVGNDRYSRHDNDSFLKILTNTQNFVFVAVDKNSLIGFAAFSVRDVVRYPKQIAELDELFVTKEYRRKGIARQLLQAVEDKAIQLKCYRLYIESHYSHDTAHKFYEAAGYTNYGYHFIKNL